MDKKRIKKVRNVLILGITFLVLLLVLIVFLIFFSMFFGGSSSKYGHRLDGIKEVTLDDKKLKDVSSALEEKESIKEASVRVQGKIVYSNIKFNEGTSIDDAKAIAKEELETFSEKELEFYDFSFFLVEDKEEEGFVITGNKHPKKEDIGWTKS